MTAAMPVWRSMLYVPVHVERFVASAQKSGADCIQLDLEDSVPDAHKAEARTRVAAAARLMKAAGADVVVRINRPLSLAVRDIEAAVGPDVDAFSVPKVDGAGHLRLLDELVGEVEQQKGLPVGRTRLIALIETAAGWQDMAAIAKASPRLVAMNLGSEDFAFDCGMEPLPEALLAPKQQLVIAARAAGLMPLGLIGSMSDMADDEGFRAVVRRSRQFGFVGASCIHPRHVPALNALFSASEDEVAQAQRVVSALEEARRAGRGAASLDGRMVDAAHEVRARRILDQAAVLRARRPPP
ncbi:CoA ester lyase [Aquincola sp. MAHUQ-54]|uniref:CoA ester lyase n=1 Tax=Aquincola agrisoli TaxID=3119538 RepID=A0AAW9QF06_9BURK